MSTPDHNFTSYADQDGVRVDGITFDPTIEGPLSSFADTFKLSHTTNSRFSNITVIGGAENAIDANRFCLNCLITQAKLIGGSQAAIVVKGGCAQMNFVDVLITPSSQSWCDVLWDDFSDQSRRPSTGTLLNVRRKDGAPVRIVFGRFVRPDMMSMSYKILWFRTIGLHVYNMVKDVLRLLHLV